jgi:hypothetical protein
VNKLLNGRPLLPNNKYRSAKEIVQAIILGATVLKIVKHLK